MRRGEHNWLASRSPTLDEFDAMARDAFRALPEEFRALCGDVVIFVEDFPDESVMAEMKLESEFDILGLYTGVALPFQENFAPPRLPNTVHLYRRPILDYWAEHDDALGDIITHVMVHEIGHHFGLSDDDMHRIEEDGG